MKMRLSLLAASTALIVGIGVPAWSSMRESGAASSLCGAGPCAAVFGDAGGKAPLIRASDDDDEKRRQMRHGHDDDDDDDCEDDEDDDDRKDKHRSPARAGSAAPPANGLFGNGAPPAAVTK